MWEAELLRWVPGAPVLQAREDEPAGHCGSPACEGRSALAAREEKREEFLKKEAAAVVSLERFEIRSPVDTVLGFKYTNLDFFLMA